MRENKNTTDVSKFSVRHYVLFLNNLCLMAIYVYIFYDLNFDLAFGKKKNFSLFTENSIVVFPRVGNFSPRHTKPFPTTNKEKRNQNKSSACNLCATVLRHRDRKSAVT